MPQAQSPRSAAPRLRSVQILGTEEIPCTPRRTASVYQAVALGRGYTVKAGAATRARLYRGIPRHLSDIENSPLGSALTSHVVEGTLESTPQRTSHTITTPPHTISETKD